MGGSGSQLKIEKNWRKFEILEKFTCIRYWSNNSVNFKNRSKSENFWHFGDFYSLLKPPMKLFLFFWYTVDPWEHVGAFFKKIQVKKLLIKIIVSPLVMVQSNSRVSLIDILLFIIGTSLSPLMNIHEFEIRHWRSKKYNFRFLIIQIEIKSYSVPRSK